jgi:hypothetical protein
LKTEKIGSPIDIKNDNPPAIAMDQKLYGMKWILSLDDVVINVTNAQETEAKIKWMLPF